MVEKLKFSTKEHPHPCNLQFLNMDNEGVIKIKMAPLLLNEFNEGKKKFKPLELLVTKELFKDKTKSCLLRLVPKSPFENVGTDFVLRILWTQQQNDSKVIVKDIFSTQGRMIENDEE